MKVRPDYPWVLLTLREVRAVSVYIIRQVRDTVNNTDIAFRKLKSKFV